MLTTLQKKTAQAIVNVFETGKPLGDYGCVTVLSGDTGGLSFGRSQATLAGGNLHKLVSAYCLSESAPFAETLRPYLERLQQRDPGLNSDRALHRALEKTGEDPAMREVQDVFFDKVYWDPAQKTAGAMAIAEPLGVAVVYDSKIHGSWGRICNRVVARVGNPASFGERQWIEEYVKERRNWLANHSNTLLHKTVYRMDAFLDLIQQARWMLDLPLVVHGVRIERNMLMPQT
jgi:chitosanase